MFTDGDAGGLRNLIRRSNYTTNRSRGTNRLWSRATAYNQVRLLITNAADRRSSNRLGSVRRLGAASSASWRRLSPDAPPALRFPKRRSARPGGEDCRSHATMRPLGQREDRWRSHASWGNWTENPICVGTLRLAPVGAA